MAEVVDKIGRNTKSNKDKRSKGLLTKSRSNSRFVSTESNHEGIVFKQAPRSVISRTSRTLMKDEVKRKSRNSSNVTPASNRSNERIPATRSPRKIEMFMQNVRSKSGGNKPRTSSSKSTQYSASKKKDINKTSLRSYTSAKSSRSGNFRSTTKK